MKIVAITSRRWEPQHLIDDFVENLKWCDETIIYDDRGRDPEEAWCDEGERYRLYHKLAGEAGATHVLVTAPDERWSPNAAEIIPRTLSDHPEMFFRAKVLEMYTPTAYRCDGEWAKRMQVRIYPWKPDQEFGRWSLHNACVPNCGKNDIGTLRRVNIYHLKPIEKGNQQKRVDLFNYIDPLGFYNQGIPYEYILDEKTMALKEIPAAQQFQPPYTSPFVFTPGRVPRD